MVVYPVLMLCLSFLFQEVNQLSCVRDVLTRSGQVATNVGNILDSFEHRLARLETTILPLYQQTGNLQRRQLSKLQLSKVVNKLIMIYGMIRDLLFNIPLGQYLCTISSSIPTLPASQTRKCQRAQAMCILQQCT